MKKLKFGDEVQGLVESVDEKGRGIVRVGEKTVFVRFSAPGDAVRATVTRRESGALIAQLTEVVSPSPHRIDPRCPYVGKCGGCPLQFVDYPAQLAQKRELVNKALGDIPLHIEAVEPSPEIFYFRNRMDYVVGPGGVLGLKEPGRWDRILDLDVCFLLSEEAVEIMKRFREFMRDTKLPAWDNRSHQGFFRYLVIREGKFTGERMTTVVTAEGTLPAEDLVRRISPLATTIYWGVNPKITDLSISERLTLLHGKPHLEEKLGDFRFKIHPNVFFQTNSGGAAKLIDIVREFAAAGRTETIFDLYCGVGTFAISLSGLAKEVHGVELDAVAIALAKENAAANGISNASFRAEMAEKSALLAQTFDLVVVDPPRSGLHPKVLETLLQSLPSRIIYVSCNPFALARDLAALQRSYAVQGIRAIDLFPHTPHVETIALLERK
ncbi:MAG: 23S rRNA (uracil(1939)-C(5))-methyltransferase RlmD [Patescibacteria group bacterium]